MKIKKILFLMGGILLILLFSFYFIKLLYDNKLEKLGLCKPGFRFIRSPSGERRYCIKTSEHNGEKCQTQKDCGNDSTCVFNEKKSSHSGICHDSVFGCVTIIDNSGNYEYLCVD